MASTIRTDTARLPADLQATGRPGQGRYMELEAFRGVAALAVVVFHAYQYASAGGAFLYEGEPAHAVLGSLDGAVAWFFVLSGFLLFLPIATTVLHGGSMPSARGFLRRRAVRILPLYVVAVLFVWAWRTPSFPGDWLDLLRHLTFTHVFFPEHLFSLIGPAWSLAVEVHYYLVLALLSPVLWLVARRLSSGRARLGLLVLVCAALAGASIAYKWHAFAVREVPLDEFTVYFGTVARADSFVFGMALGVLVAALPRGTVLPPPALWALRAGGVAVLVWAALERTPGSYGSLFFNTVVGVSAVLVIAGSVLAPRDARWVDVLSWGPLGAIGLWSYSIYLWHEPLTHELGLPTGPFWLTLVLFLAVSIPVGAISYWVIEFPASQLRHLTERPRRA